jgi:hypothetical protein
MSNEPTGCDNPVCNMAFGTPIPSALCPFIGVSCGKGSGVLNKISPGCAPYASPPYAN